MLDEARRGKYLAELFLGKAANGAVMVKHESARAGCSLVKGEDETHCP
jgi:hypothetical protein